jgi:hypothetical protein
MSAALELGEALVKQSPVVPSVCRGPRCIAICSQPLHSGYAPRRSGLWMRLNVR